MALSYGTSFVARLFAGDPETITRVLEQGIRHNGFSFFHLYTSCVTFDKTFKTWEHLKEWTHPLPDSYDPSDLKSAMAEALDDPFSLGILYRREGA
jgi:2-oxoglutarate ferredoxin oxidoreductase subunit beta